MKRLLITIGLLLVGSGLYVGLRQALPVLSPTALPNYPIRQINIGSETFSVLITQTQKERELGLGAVRILPKHHGMLFEFSEGGEVGIWMKGMRYPIDILWLDARMHVIHIERSVEPSSYPAEIFKNPPGTSAHFVLEVNADEAARLGVKNGQHIDLSNHHND